MLIAPLLLACADPGGAVDPPHRNLVLLSIDTLRRDHVGRYSGSGETPFMDGLAERAMALDSHHACSNWTYGAFMCLLGGADGVDVGFVPAGGADTEVIPAELPLLPGTLRAAGFRTALISTNGYVGGTSKLDRYYDSFFHEGMAPADEVVGWGLETMDELRGAERWMLHLHFFDPHSPYGAPDAYLGELDALDPIDYQLDEIEEINRLARQWPGLDAATQALILEHLDVRYRASIRFLDDELERLIDALEASGDLDDALLVILSDHGEQFYEYGEQEHGKTLHGVEVDSFVWLLGRGVSPGSWTQPTTHADLTPTLLSLLGLPPESGRPAGDLGGLGAALGEADPERPLFAVKLEGADTQHSVDRGGKRLIYTWDGRRQLYDLGADPEEGEDLWGGDPEGEALWSLLLPRVQALADMTEGASPVLP